MGHSPCRSLGMDSTNEQPKPPGGAVAKLHMRSWANFFFFFIENLTRAQAYSSWQKSWLVSSCVLLTHLDLTTSTRALLWTETPYDKHMDMCNTCVSFLRFAWDILHLDWRSQLFEGLVVPYASQSRLQYLKSGAVVLITGYCHQAKAK